jgi:sortase A
LSKKFNLLQKLNFDEFQIVSAKKTPEQGRAKVTIGLALMAVGAVVFLAAVGFWLLPGLFVPEGFEPPNEGGGNTHASPNAINSQPAGQPTAETPILLPESPLEGELPSFAAVSEAPTFYNPSVPGQPVRIIIPKIDVDAAVHRIGLQTLFEEGIRYFQWAVPSGYAAGWHETSATLGQPGNTILNGHNNIYGEVFRDLVDLEFGDTITLYDNAGQTYVYEVQQQELLPESGQPISVRIENADWIEATDDERITLISCWPYATNDYRVVVIARPAG